MKTIEEVMELLNVKSKKTIYYRIKHLGLGDAEYKLINKECIKKGKKEVTRVRTRVFTDNQVEKILEMSVSKGGRGHKDKNSIRSAYKK